MLLKDIPHAPLACLQKLKQEMQIEAKTDSYTYTVIKVLDTLIAERLGRQVADLQVAKERAAQNNNFTLFATLSQDIRTLQDNYIRYVPNYSHAPKQV